MRVKMLALDLDDTLLHEDLTISRENIEAIGRAEAAGIKIVLASGRNLVSLSKYADLLGLTRPGDFLVCSNGAELVAADTRTILDRRMLEPALCREVAAELARHGAEWQIYVDGKILCTTLNEWALRDGFLTGQPVEEVGDAAAREGHFSRGLIKFVIPGDPARVQELLRELAPVFAGRAEVLTSKPYFLEILPLGADKGSALARLAGMLGFDMADVMAVGDAMNDYTMISRAGWGCAPANAIPAIRDIARVVSPLTNDGNAVADLIDRVALAV